MKLLWLLPILLTGCHSGMFAQKQELLSSETCVFIVVAVNPPKHVYVDLIHVDTGEKHGHIYVSKHFNNWSNIKLGSKINVKVDKWKWTDGNTRTEYCDLRAKLEECASSGGKQ